VRRALAAALLATLALAATAHAAPPRRSFVLPESVVGRPALLDNSLFYIVRTRRDEVVKRLDLTTLQSVPVYSKPKAAWGFAWLRSGGGRVALEVDDRNPRGGLASKVVELPAAGGPARVVASGLVRNSRLHICGTEVSLEDVSPEGALVIDRSATGCRPGAVPRHAIRRYPAAGPVTVIRRFNERSSDEGRQWRLVGDRLLEATERGAVVRNLVTRGVRRIRRRGRGYLVTWADLDAAGNVALGELRFPSRTARSFVRLFPPSGPARILFDAAGTQDEPRLCGPRLVELRVSRSADELLVHDDLAAPARSLFSRPHVSRALEVQLACDQDTAVLVNLQATRRTAVDVVPLAP
jgi:hypothetical protein